MDEFRETLSLVPGAVSIIATSGAAGPAGLTVTSFTSLSAAPPLVLFCIGNTARSFAPISESEVFSVNVLSTAQSDVARLFASKSENKWDSVAYECRDGRAPLLADCVANLECERYAMLPGGDHTIVVGQVIACHRRHDLEPLVYRDRNFWKLKEIHEIAA